MQSNRAFVSFTFNLKRIIGISWVCQNVFTVDSLLNLFDTLRSRQIAEI
jgi:hypothetical protein